MDSTIFYICDREACDKCNEFCFHTTDITHAKNFIKSTNPLCITEYNYWENDEKDRMDDEDAKKELRLCKVGKKIGYFHCWEQYADVMAPGLTVGSHQGGQYYRVFGIVEFNDGIERVDPEKIKFIDEYNASLVAMNKIQKENDA